MKQAALAAEKLGTLERQRSNMNQILEELEQESEAAQLDIDEMEEGMAAVDGKSAATEAEQMKERIGSCLRRMSNRNLFVSFQSWLNASKVLGRGELLAQAESDTARARWYSFLVTSALAQSVQAGSVLSAMSRSRIEAAKREQMLQLEGLPSAPAAPPPGAAASPSGIDAKALAHDSLCIYVGHVRLALRRSAAIAFRHLQLHGRG
jgi:hypothetical protein